MRITGTWRWLMLSGLISLPALLEVPGTAARSTDDSHLASPVQDGSAVGLQTVAAPDRHRTKSFDVQIADHALDLLNRGRYIFRFDTFGDEASVGGTLHLHEAIEGSRFGGVGPGLSPAAALSVGLKVDAQALSPATLSALRSGRVNLNDPAVTLALMTPTPSSASRRRETRGAA